MQNVVRRDARVATEGLKVGEPVALRSELKKKYRKKNLLRTLRLKKKISTEGIRLESP